MYDVRHYFGKSAGSLLFLSERDSDVAITVEWEGEKWHFPAHKLYLCTMSEVFRTMLETDMIEKRSKAITIRDSNPLTVKQFLKYLYIGTVDFTDWLQAVNLLKIAHEYNVQTLINICETYLGTSMGFSNVCYLHDFSRTYSLKTLKKETKLLILDAGFFVSATDGFSNLRPRSMESFISDSHFNMENEGSVLTSLREWAVCDCSRRCMALSRSNVLLAMEPFLKHIRWSSIPENHRTFVPYHLTEKYMSEQPSLRKELHMAASLQYHMNYVKFVVELGTFYEQKTISIGILSCLKFSIDDHAYLSGFRMVGLFTASTCFLTGPAYLTLTKDDKTIVQINLNSLPWTRGANVGREIWHELIAYLPYHIRLDPFSTYSMNIKSRRSEELESARWPKTRLDSETVPTLMGNFKVYGSSYGITQLFVLPASPYRNICNVGNDR